MITDNPTGYIEDPVDLNLLIENLNFNTVSDIEIEKQQDIEVYDLEVENQHNYIVEGLGLVHNGGGK
jgi:intein/homing endonuclease